MLALQLGGVDVRRPVVHCHRATDDVGILRQLRRQPVWRCTSVGVGEGERARAPIKRGDSWACIHLSKLTPLSHVRSLHDSSRRCGAAVNCVDSADVERAALELCNSYTDKTFANYWVKSYDVILKYFQCRVFAQYNVRTSILAGHSRTMDELYWTVA